MTTEAPEGGASPLPRAYPLPRIYLVLVSLAALVIGLAGMRAVAGIIGPAFLALVLTITIHPIRVRMVRRGMPEWLVSLIALITVYLILVTLTIMLVISVARLAALVPQYSDEIKNVIDDFGNWLQSLGVKQQQIDDVTGSFNYDKLFSVATSVLTSTLAIVSNLFFVVLLLLFIVFDTSKMGHALEKLQPYRPELVTSALHFAKGARTYIGVSAGFGLIVAVIDTIALYIMGVPGAFVWGVLAFVTNFIPNIGFVIGVIPPAVLGLLEGGWGLMVAVIVVYCVINFVIQSVIQPRYVGDAVGLSPTVTMLSLVFWAWALGALGALLAVPLTLLLKALLVEADPSAQWALPLISGLTGDEEPKKTRKQKKAEKAAALSSAAATGAQPSDA